MEGLPNTLRKEFCGSLHTDLNHIDQDQRLVTCLNQSAQKGSIKGLIRDAAQRAMSSVLGNSRASLPLLGHLLRISDLRINEGIRKGINQGLASACPFSAPFLDPSYLLQYTVTRRRHRLCSCKTRPPNAAVRRAIHHTSRRV